MGAKQGKKSVYCVSEDAVATRVAFDDPFAGGRWSRPTPGIGGSWVALAGRSRPHQVGAGWQDGARWEVVKKSRGVVALAIAEEKHADLSNNDNESHNARQTLA